MSRKCFLSDGDHWYSIDMDRKGFFNSLNNFATMYEENDEKYWEAVDRFEEEFGSNRLSMHLSNYSFDDLQEMD